MDCRIAAWAIVAHINGFGGEAGLDEARRFGRYRLVQLRGRNGIGEEWRAFDPVADQFVVLRMLPADWSVDRDFRLRFQRDAAAAAALNEPHVVTIHDFGEIGGRLFVTSRLVEGRSLRDLLHDGPLAPARAVWIIEQIASALHAGHAVGLVHSDVKPTNILVTEDDFAYLTDFGIVTREMGVTTTGASRGADWAYMAPERFRRGTANVGSDVYGLTCVLYQSLTARPPFGGEGREQLAAHMFRPPAQPSKIQPGVPPAMDQVIATGMAKDPDRRYPTTKHLAKAARLALSTPVRPATWSVTDSVGTTPRPAKRSRRQSIDVATSSPTTAVRPRATAPASARARTTDKRSTAAADLAAIGGRNRIYRPRHAGRHRVATTPTSSAPSVGHPLPRWMNITFFVITVSAVAALVVTIVILGHDAFRGENGSLRPPGLDETITPSQAQHPVAVNGSIATAS